MVTVSIFSIVLLIFVLHTILSHLLNWFFRELMDDESVILAIAANFAELAIVIYLLNNFIQ